MRLLLFIVFLAGPVCADEPLDAEAFEALVEGKTLTFLVGTDPYGVEYYAPNRRVVWSLVGGECVSGEWYEEPTKNGPNICFVYENGTEPQCWQVFDINGKIRADFMNTPGTTILYEAVETEPLICGGVGT